ncbi:MAG: hypothetical protein ACOYEA_00570 [Fermentimonas sp.]|jgi:uncharacterized membrane protein HdeD (DUF308 family)
MKEFAKYIGALVMLIGVAVLAVPFFSGSLNNLHLICGLLLMLNGFLGHIFVNNMKKGTVASNILWAVVLLVVPYFLYVVFKKMAYTEEEIAAYN